MNRQLISLKWFLLQKLTRPNVSDNQISWGASDAFSVNFVCLTVQPFVNPIRNWVLQPWNLETKFKILNFLNTFGQWTEQHEVVSDSGPRCSHLLRKYLLCTNHSTLLALSLSNVRMIHNAIQLFVRRACDNSCRNFPSEKVKKKDKKVHALQSPISTEPVADLVCKLDTLCWWLICYLSNTFWIGNYRWVLVEIMKLTAEKEKCWAPLGRFLRFLPISPSQKYEEHNN